METCNKITATILAAMFVLNIAATGLLYGNFHYEGLSVLFLFQSGITGIYLVEILFLRGISIYEATCVKGFFVAANIVAPVVYMSDPFSGTLDAKQITTCEVCIMLLFFCVFVKLCKDFIDFCCNLFSAPEDETTRLLV